MYVWASVWGAQETTSKSCFFPTMWGQGLKLRSSGFAEAALTHWAILPAHDIFNSYKTPDYVPWHCCRALVPQAPFFCHLKMPFCWASERQPFPLRSKLAILEESGSTERPSQQLVGTQAILRKLCGNRSQNDLQQSTLTASHPGMKNSWPLPGGAAAGCRPRESKLGSPAVMCSFTQTRKDILF